eukprot:353182-Chlamydomonas_euryale.AAC.59
MSANHVHLRGRHAQQCCWWLTRFLAMGTRPAGERHWPCQHTHCFANFLASCIQKDRLTTE